MALLTMFNVELIPRRVAQKFELFGAYSGAVFFIGAGIIGYDTGRRVIVDGVTEETRWISGPLWMEIGIGLAALAYALFKHRQFRRNSNSDQD